MDLSIIKQYAHKIKVIDIENKNKHSTYKYVVIRINLYCDDNEVVRFSLSDNDNFIEHQHISQKNNTNDYYCYIPNRLNQITTLYAHFFPSDLYTYENELDTIVFPFDFNDLDNDTIQSNSYNQQIDDDTLIVQSTDATSVTGNYDPNYKNYTTINSNVDNNETEKGKFPLSSQYRSEQNWEVPILNNTNPKWGVTDQIFFVGNPVEHPYWETKIPTEWAHAPMNVYLNYEYLPTSREYHQHMFGFEPATTDKTTVNVLEGTNINILDNKFGSKNNYRLTHLQDIYNDDYSMYVDHDNTIPIDLNDFFEQNCRWNKNRCEDYYIYTPIQTTQKGYCIQPINLQSNKWYSLKYYMYIPSYATISDNECYISVITDNDTYTIPSAFIEKDKNTRDVWIYHEIPFLASEQNIIKIIGPQSFDKERDKDNSIYFTNMSLYMYTEYTPQLQYTNTGIHLSEKSESTYMPLSAINDTSYTEATIIPDDKKWKPTELKLPIPYNDIEILINGESEDEKLYGIYGPNNSFSFKIIDMNGNFVNNGTIEAGIFSNEDHTNDINAAIIKLSPMATNVEGIVTYNNINLKKLTPNAGTSNKYYVRLEYQDPCRDVSKIIFKELFVEEEKITLSDIQINGSTVNHKGKQILDNGYVINETDEFPMQIKMHITDQIGHNKTDGYCELSIDDTVHQTTIVDDGWVDFYFNPSDFKVGTQTIKIEYYREYFDALAFIYFDLEMLDGLNFKDSVLIEVKIVTPDGIRTLPVGQNYIVDNDSCVLNNIIMNNHSRFRIEIYRDDELLDKRNIYSSNVNIPFIHAPLSDRVEHTFKIITGNMKDEDGKVIEDLWKDYERTFMIKYK